MADSSISVSGPVAIKTDSTSRVAYDLMVHVSGWENTSSDEKKSREYWLKLYSQCHHAASGHSLATVLGQS